jgi:hypothetical protein
LWRRVCAMWCSRCVFNRFKPLTSSNLFEPSTPPKGSASLVYLVFTVTGAVRAVQQTPQEGMPKQPSTPGGCSGWVSARPLLRVNAAGVRPLPAAGQQHLHLIRCSLDGCAEGGVGLQPGRNCGRGLMVAPVVEHLRAATAHTRVQVGCCNPVGRLRRMEVVTIK